MQNPEMKTTKPSLVMPEGIGERIRIIRRAANLTQTQLAEALGVVQQSVSAWERGWTLPGVETLWAFCKLTGVSADKVLGLPGALYSCCDDGVATPDSAMDFAPCDEDEDEDEGPYYCTATDCLHFQNGECKTGGVGCYL